MDFSLSDDERLIQDTARQIAREVIRPRAAETDATATFPHDNVKQLAELGFMGMMVAEEFGGAGLSTMAYALAIEEISAACASTGVIMSVNNSLVCHPIEKFGTDDQKKRYLSKLATGEWLGAYCLSEPDTGSDAARQKTMATRKGDRYVLNGTKNFITNGQVADLYVVYCMTDAAAGHRGISSFLVEATTTGLTRGAKEKTMGIRGSSTCQIILTDCEIPAENLLGSEGEGFKVALNTLDGGRIGIASQALGIGAACLHDSTRYANERHAFGAAIGQFQAIQWMIADMATELDAARLLTWQAACAKDAGRRYTMEASVAKAFASRMAVVNADRAVQVHGGYGYLQDYAVERYYRDAKVTEIYEGTTEIQKHIIASGLLKS
jgi:butyryl-CoA dehydrogenase